MSIPTTNQGYIDAAAYAADPSSVDLLDGVHNAYLVGVLSYLLNIGGDGSLIDADEANSKLGFFGATPVVQPTALTAAETTLTNAGTASDYAIQALTNSSPYGFASQAEGETVVEVVLNNQARINEIETKLQALGLLA